MKKILSIALSLLIFCTANVNAMTLIHGAYGASANTSYSNPDTGIIDDKGSDDALGGAMSRSCTGTTALIEKDGDKYYVTVRLLLQSSTNDAKFWERTGNDTYQAVNYEIIAENAVADSIDYRFEVADPFAPLKVSMYVVPMGRDVVWYILLDESTVTADTGDFIVSVKAIEVAEDEVTQPEIIEPEQLQTEEVVAQDVEVKEEIVEPSEVIEVLTSEQIEEEISDEDLQEQEIEEENSDEKIEDEQEEIVVEETQEEINESSFSFTYIALCGVIFAVFATAGWFFAKKRGK